MDVPLFDVYQFGIAADECILPVYVTSTDPYENGALSAVGVFASMLTGSFVLIVPPFGKKYLMLVTYFVVPSGSNTSEPYLEESTVNVCVPVIDVYVGLVAT
jgi:hypothetical protein